ncbi:hypothetical protein [Desulfoluna spongiiphila]|uniref:Uncharacterized protein n=1 Tax=Desulfoluna spongiiphila TaxID=419481 RepID=A0A1G5HWY8_9BACT|nr:hypothetical protein [Desulfoluna spongiiphila]SCY68247.1 hypothetical protein SAMN05216233_11646 [Desulfoluna spongiiphila]
MESMGWVRYGPVSVFYVLNYKDFQILCQGKKDRPFTALILLFFGGVLGLSGVIDYREGMFSGHPSYF